MCVASKNQTKSIKYIQIHRHLYNIHYIYISLSVYIHTVISWETRFVAPTVSPSLIVGATPLRRNMDPAIFRGV